MTEQEIRELNFGVYCENAEQLPECPRCEGWGQTDEDRARDPHFGRCEPCFGTGFTYPGDAVVAQGLPRS